MKTKSLDYERLNAFIDGELDHAQREKFLASLDDDSELKGELCDVHRIKDLLNFAYPLTTTDEPKELNNRINFMAIAASLLVVLSLGFMGGYLSASFFGANDFVTPKSSLALNDAASLQAVALPQGEKIQNKVIIYLGSSEKNKFDETLNKAEMLLNKYRQEGTEVYVVTSAGGIDLLRTNNSGMQQRIKKMKGLYESLHFVACNNQIYQLHKKGQPVNLVNEAEVAPSAVQFVVDHLKNGWRYIAI